MYTILSSKRNYYKSIQQYNEFNKVTKQKGYCIYGFQEYYKTSNTHKLLLNIPEKINLKRSDKYVALSNLSIHFKWRNFKKSYKNNAFRMLAQTRNEEFQVLGGLYSVSDIQDFFEYILKNMEKRLIILQ